MKISARLLCLPLLCLTCSIAVASNIVILDYDAGSEDYAYKIDMRSVTAGRLYILGQIGRQYDTDPDHNGPGLFGLDLSNPLSNTFGSNGRFLVGPTDVVARPDGSFVALEGLRVVASDPAGNPTMTATVTGAPAAGGIALQADGKILVGGAVGCGYLACTPQAAQVTRLNADGTVDATFFGGPIAMGSGVAINQLIELPDGKIAVAGGNSVVLLNGDGTLNTGFGMNSTVTFNGIVAVLGTDSQSRIYVQSGTGSPQRVLQDGSIDSTFTVTAINPSALISGLAIDSMQRIVVFGEFPTAGAGSNGTGYIARLTATGALDNSFNGTGEITVPLPAPFPDPNFGPPPSRECVGALQPDDKPVLACNVQGPGSHDVAVARYNADGTPDASLGATVPDFTYYPDPFTFQSASAPYGAAYVISNPVTITGINVNTTVRASELIGGIPTAVQGGTLSLGCNGQFTSSTVLASAGQTFCIRGSASSQPGGTATVQVNVGGRLETFTINSTNTPATTTPNAFSFTNQSDVDLSAVVTSNAVTISGITGFANVTVTGDNGFAKYSVGCDPASFTGNPGKVGPGQTICVQVLADSTYSAAETATLTVGGVSAAFTVTVKAAPSPPPSNGSSGGGGSGGGGAFDELSLAVLACFTLAWVARRARSESR